MFREDLQERLKKIFQVDKVTFNAPSDEFEQDVLFVEIENSVNRIIQGKATAKVTGQLVMYSQEQKLPYGFFSKAVSQAKAELTKPLFFFDMDTNVESSQATMMNLTERRTSFLFLYSEQYDPRMDPMTGLELECKP